MVLATFWKNDNSSCFDIPIVSTESQGLYSIPCVLTMLAERQGVSIALTQFCPCSNLL